MTTPDLADLRDLPVRTPLDLQRLWQALMGDGGFGRRSLWLLFLQPDGRPLAQLVPIDDVPLRPDPTSVDGLGRLVYHLFGDADEVTGPGGTVAMLLSRPGTATMSADDRAWARAVAPITSWPVHLATRGHVQVFAADDLVPAR